MQGWACVSIIRERIGLFNTYFSGVGFGPSSNFCPIPVDEIADGSTAHQPHRVLPVFPNDDEGLTDAAAFLDSKGFTLKPEGLDAIMKAAVLELKKKEA